MNEEEERPHVTEPVVGWANLKEEHRFGVPRGEGEQGEVQLVLQPFCGGPCPLLFFGGVGTDRGPCLPLAHSNCALGWLHLLDESLGFDRRKSFSGPLCVRFGFSSSWEDKKHPCKPKLACHLYQGLDCLLCGKTQQPHIPFSDLSGLLTRMLGMARCCPGLCLALAKVSLSGRKKGRGHSCLVRSSPARSFMCKLDPSEILLGATPIPHFPLPWEGVLGHWWGHSFRSCVRLTCLCSVLGLLACRHLAGVTKTGKPGCLPPPQL